MEMFRLLAICPFDNDCGSNFYCWTCSVRCWTCNEDDECTNVDCRDYNAVVLSNLVSNVPASLESMTKLLAGLIILATVASRT